MAYVDAHGATHESPLSRIVERGKKKVGSCEPTLQLLSEAAFGYSKSSLPGRHFRTQAVAHDYPK